MKPAAFARFALDPDFAAHTFDETRGDAEPEARAAEFARGGAIGLGESFEDRGLFLDGNTNPGVGDGYIEFDGLCRLRFCGNVRDNLACLSELDSVAGKIDDDLAKAARISNQFIRHVGLDVPGEFEALLMGAQGEGFHGVAETIAEIEVDCVDVQLTGFD